MNRQPIAQPADLRARPDETENEERFRLAFAHAAHGIAVLNGDSRYVAANPALCEMLGYDETELLGRHFSDVTHSNDLKTAYEQHRALRQAPQSPVEWEMRFLRKDGHPVWTRVVMALIGDGEPQVLCEVEDITERRAEELERQRIEEQVRRSQRMEAVGRLAGGVAHEFNNMLSVILNNVDFADRRLGDEKPGDAVRPYLQAVRQAALHSSSLVRQLMIFGRCDVAAPQVLDLNETIAHLEPILRRTLGPDVELVVHGDVDLCRVYLATPHAEQVLLNLVLNAREAMPRGGRVTITTNNVELEPEAARTRVGVRAGRYVQLVVDDTGVGMSQDTLARCFEPFFTTKQPGEGPGLGLSIVYGIIEESGGHIHAESAPGAGARFEILLPATDVAPRQDRSRDIGPAPGGKGERVLVVEDEPAVRELTCHILRENGYDVWTVNGPEEALQKLMNDQAPLDLLLTDVIMPRLSGTDLAAYVTALRPTAKVLFMSGRADEHIGRHRVKRKEVAFLQKPFNADELLRAVREVIDARTGAEPPPA